ncbi:hypothetical protein MHYP_G00193020 [Metynnis hypsauchen]
MLPHGITSPGLANANANTQGHARALGELSGLFLPRSKIQEYLSHLGQKVLASFPVQATLHFYNDDSSSEEDDDEF